MELILNTNRVNRPLNLIKVSRKMKKYVNTLGSTKAAAEDLKLSPRMVNLFLTVLGLPPEIKSLIEERKIESLDLAYRLTLLDNLEDQVFLASKYIEGEIETKDVREIVSIKRKKPDTGIKEILSDFYKYKDTKRYRYVLSVFSLGRRKPGGTSAGIRNEIEKKIEGELGSNSLECVEISGSVVALTLTEVGYRLLQRRAKKLGISKKEAVTEILCRKG